MKSKLYFLIFIQCALGISQLNAQGFTPPSEGNPVIYFTRVTSYGRSAWFKYFENDTYLGRAKGQNYIRYECSPGKHLFWLSCDNSEYLTADLRLGGTYIVIVDVYKGFNAVVGLNIIEPANPEDEELFLRAKDLILNNAPYELDLKDKGKSKLNKFIQEELAFYKEKIKGENKYKHLSPDMAISLEKLK